MEHFKCLICYVNLPDIPQLHTHHMSHSLSDLSHALLSLQGLALLSEAPLQSPSICSPKPLSRKEPKNKLSDDFNLSCSLCSKVLSSKRNLTKHLARHNIQKPFHCHDCNRGFNAKRDFDFHNLRLHSSGPKPYTCGVCGKGFVEKHYLKIHATFHTSDRNYVCETCSAAFKNANSLRKHQKSHQTSRPFLCDSCPKTFREKYDLTAHVRSVHLKIKYQEKVASGTQPSQTLSVAMASAGVGIDSEDPCFENEKISHRHPESFCELDKADSLPDVDQRSSSICSMPLLET